MIPKKMSHHDASLVDCFLYFGIFANSLSMRQVLVLYKSTILPFTDLLRSEFLPY